MRVPSSGQPTRTSLPGHPVILTRPLSGLGLQFRAETEQHIIFDPIPRVDGIEASADPLFEPRANIYLMTGRRRRAAGKQ